MVNRTKTISIGYGLFCVLMAGLGGLIGAESVRIYERVSLCSWANRAEFTSAHHRFDRSDSPDFERQTWAQTEAFFAINAVDTKAALEEAFEKNNMASQPDWGGMLTAFQNRPSSAIQAHRDTFNEAIADYQEAQAAYIEAQTEFMQSENSENQFASDAPLRVSLRRFWEADWHLREGADDLYDQYLDRCV